MLDCTDLYFQQVSIFACSVIKPMKANFKFTLAVLSLGLLAGCDNNIDYQKIRKQGFVFCGQSTPDSLSPQQAKSDITTRSLGPQIYDSLLILDPVTQKPMPNIASSWHVSEDGTEYWFTLRKNVEFQATSWFTPTRTLNASDVVFSFNRILDTTHPFHDIGSGSYPWFEGIRFRTLINNVSMIDDYTVKFTLTKADNTFLSNISTNHAVILSQEYGEQLELQGKKHHIDDYPIGSGPFYLAEYQRGDLIRLKRHKNYWQGIPESEQIVFDISSQGTGPLAKLLRQECDVLDAPLSNQIPIIREQPELILEAKSSMNIAYIAINTEHPALNDQRVRKALSLSIDRKRILDSVYYGTGEQAYSLLPPTSWAYEKDSVHLRYDKDYAIGLLRDAGYLTDLKLSMWVSLEPTLFNPSPRKTAELIQSGFAEIGIDLTLYTSDQFSQAEMSEHTNVDLVLTGWSARTGDPDNILRPLLSCNDENSDLNVTMWCNPEFDFLLDLARETNEERYRLNLYKQAQYIMNDDVPVIPLAHGALFQTYHHSLTGFEMSSFSSRSFHKVRRVK